MSEQTNKPKKKLIHFQFGIRKELFKSLIFIAIFMAAMVGLMPLLGINNAMAASMGIVFVLMTLSNDYTLEPIKNTISLVLAQAGIVMGAFLGYAFFPPGTAGYTIMTTTATFLCFFLAVYLFTSEEKSNLYMPLLLSFSLLMYYPVYGVELIIRLAIVVGLALVAMGINFLLHKNKFRKKIRESLDGAINNLKELCKAIQTNEPKDALKERSAVIEKTITGISGAMGPKLSVRSNWQAGHDIMRTLTILKRINHTLTKYYIEGNAKMTEEVYLLLEDMLQSIDKFENDEITESEIVTKFDALHTHMNPDLNHNEVLSAIKEEMTDFIQGEVRHEDKAEAKRSFGDWLRSKINVYNIIFALKTSVLAAIGVAITSALNMPNAYIFPLTIAVVAQPYFELGSKKIHNRIVNTFFAIIMILISFSITQNIWIHVAILAALLIIGDMFFQFDFNVIMATFSSVVIKVIANPTSLVSVSLYRFGYVVAACLLLLAVDILIFPNRITATVQKQLQNSLSIDQKLRSELTNGDASYESVHAILMEKRRADQKLKNTNRFAKNEQVTAYLLANEEWINRLTMVNHRLRETNLHMGDLRNFIDSNADNSDLIMTNRQKNIVSSFNEILEEMTKSEELASRVLA